MPFALMRALLGNFAEYDVPALTTFLQTDFLLGKDPHRPRAIVYRKQESGGFLSPRDNSSRTGERKPKTGHILEVRDIGEWIDDSSSAGPEPTAPETRPPQQGASASSEMGENPPARRLQVVSSHWLNVKIDEDIMGEEEDGGDHVEGGDVEHEQTSTCSTSPAAAKQSSTPPPDDPHLRDPRNDIRIHYVLVSTVIAEKLSPSSKFSRFRALTPAQHDGNVAFSHGFMMNVGCWLPTARALNAERNFQGLVYEHPGHGKSGWGTGMGRNVEAFMGSRTDRVMRKVVEEVGWAVLWDGMPRRSTGTIAIDKRDDSTNMAAATREGITVAGLSLGGRAVAWYTRNWGFSNGKRHVSRVVLVAAAGNNEEAWVRNFAGNFFAGLFRRFAFLLHEALSEKSSDAVHSQRAAPEEQFSWGEAEKSSDAVHSRQGAAPEQFSWGEGPPAKLSVPERMAAAFLRRLLLSPITHRSVTNFATMWSTVKQWPT